MYVSNQQQMFQIDIDTFAFLPIQLQCLSLR